MQSWLESPNKPNWPSASCLLPPCSQGQIDNMSMAKAQGQGLISSPCTTSR